MATVAFWAAYGSGATVTSTRYYPRKGHRQLTVTVANKTGAITWIAYAVSAATGLRVALNAARAVAAGAADAASFQGTFDAIEVDVANTNATAGAYCLEIVGDQS